jgi:3-hydroxyisobutyrate dehydrogenase
MADGPGALVAGVPVAFFGLGRMGTPMACRLVAAGYDVRAHDLDEGARERFAAAAGRKAHAAAGEALAGAAALVLMLPDSGAVRDAVSGRAAEALPAGALVVDMSSSDPTCTRELAPELAGLGLGLVDAPVSGGVPGAEAGTLTIMAGGDADSVGRCRPLFEALGRAVHHVGPVGAGHALKALNNLLSATHLLSSIEVLRVGRRFGLDPATLVETVNGSTGRSWSTEHKLPRFVLTGSYDAGFAMQLMNKDVQTALALAHALGVPVPLGDAAGTLWERAAAELDRGADHTEIARWVETSLPAG